MASLQEAGPKVKELQDDGCSTDKELQQGQGKFLLAWVPFEQTHTPMTTIEKMLEATTAVIKSRALKHMYRPLTI